MIGALGYTCNVQTWRALAAAHKINIYPTKIVSFETMSSLLSRTCTGTKVDRHIAFEFDLALIGRCLESKAEAEAAPIKYQILLDIWRRGEEARAMMSEAFMIKGGGEGWRRS